MKLFRYLLAGGQLLLVSSTVEAALPPVIDRTQFPVAKAPPASRVVKQSLEQRVAKLERKADNQALVELLSQVEALQAGFQQFQGQLDVQDHNLEGLKKRQRDLYLDIDERLRKIEAQLHDMKASSSVAPKFNPGLGNVQSNGAIPGGSENVVAGEASTVMLSKQQLVELEETVREETAYQDAFDNLREQKYSEAITQLQQFITQYPHSQFADNAQYWLGEAKYVTRLFPAAVKEFDKVIKQFPDSPKVPDAMLKAGFAHYELQQWGLARNYLKKLTEQFPAATSARLAAKRLQKMRSEGH